MSPVQKVETTIQFVKQFQKKVNSLLASNYSPDI
jgi:hypothetical protein